LIICVQLVTCMASFFILWSLLYLGYLDLGHCNFSELEKHHYYSHILNRAIAILNFPQICHEIHMKTTRAQLQAYANMYISLHLHFLVNDMRVPLVSIFFLLPSTADPSTADELTPLIDSVRVEAQKGPPGRGIPDPPVVAGCGSRRGCSRDWRGAAVAAPREQEGTEPRVPTTAAAPREEDRTGLRVLMAATAWGPRRPQGNRSPGSSRRAVPPTPRRPLLARRGQAQPRAHELDLSSMAASRPRA
jgi:hypothetical protein